MSTPPGNCSPFTAGNIPAGSLHFARVCFVLTALVLSLVASSSDAWAVPSFARQTGQPCASCHVGAFGPQLTPYGREFKLNGYVWSDNKPHVPVAAMVQSSFTHTHSDQAGGAAPGFGENDNLALDQASLFFAGRISANAGAFVQLTYDGIAKNFSWDNLDVRYAKQTLLGGHPLLFGVTLNNSPTVQDVWNSTPAWGFPFAQSGLGPQPATATMIDGAAAQQVLGVGAYALWNNLLYMEADVYTPLGRSLRRALGVGPKPGDNKIRDAFPYWRVALQHQFSKHYLEIGSFGLSERISPMADRSQGADRYTDTGVDLSYMFTGNENHRLTGYITYIHESQTLSASSRLLGSRASDTLDTLRLSASYSYRNTVTLSGQHFSTSGSSDPALYPDTGRPNSHGWIGEIAYVPSGKADSRFPSWLNARLSLQYTAYGEFDGITTNASKNNTLFLLLWLAY
jgi:hypothetical protein